MRAVNLLPRETRNRRSARRVDPLLAGGAALTFVVVAALVGGFALAHSNAASEQHKLADARATLARLQAQNPQPTATPTLPVPSVTGQTQPWLAALETALATRVAWDDVLAQLSRVVPPDVTVSNLTLGGGASAGTTGATGSLTLGGQAFSESGVARLLARLALVPDLAQVTLTTSTADPKSGVVTFTLSAQIQGTTTPFTTAAPGVAS